MGPSTGDDLRRIQNLLADYAATLDQGRWEEHAELWLEEGELHVFGRSFRGREAIDRFMRQTVRGKHVTAVPRVEIEGDVARSVADYVFFRSSDRVLYSAGVYRDEMRRAGEGWRLARREIEIQLRHED